MLYCMICRGAGNLYEQMSGNTLSSSAVSNLSALVQALNAGDADEALKKHHLLVGTDWTGNQMWLPGVKTILTLTQQAGKTK